MVKENESVWKKGKIVRGDTEPSFRLLLGTLDPPGLSSKRQATDAALMYILY